MACDMPRTSSVTVAAGLEQCAAVDTQDLFRPEGMDEACHRSTGSDSNDHDVEIRCLSEQLAAGFDVALGAEHARSTQRNDRWAGARLPELLSDVFNQRLGFHMIQSPRSYHASAEEPVQRQVAGFFWRGFAGQNQDDIHSEPRACRGRKQRMVAL